MNKFCIRKKDYIKIGLFALFFIQFSFVIYFNIACLSNHMGYDSSWAYLKSALVWKERTLFSNVWEDQTNNFYDSSLLLASLLFGITKNVFVSYGLSNIIFDLIVIILIRQIFKENNINVEFRLIAYNLIICPFLLNGFSIVNDLSYFNNFLTGPSFYTGRVIIMLLIILNFSYLHKGKQAIVVYILSILLCFIAGASSGLFVVIMVVVPYLLYEFEKVLIKNDWKSLFEGESIYIYLCALASIIGKIFSQVVLKMEVIDATRTWTSIEDIWKNIGAVFQGLMKLLGVLPLNETESENIISGCGIIRVFVLLIFAVLILSIIYNLYNLLHSEKEVFGIRMLLLNIVIVNIVCFCLFNVQYGSFIFEERYLIVTYVSIVMLISLFFNEIYDGKIWNTLLLIAVIISVAVIDARSNYIYITTTNEEWKMDEIAAYVENCDDVGVVYVWGDDIICIARALRVYDLNHVYKSIDSEGNVHHWGDYLYYDDAGSYIGRTILLTESEDIIPKYIMDQYEYIKTIGSLKVYLSNTNPIDNKTGISGDICIDYPYTDGIYVNNGRFVNGEFVTNGREGYCMWGPYTETVDGVFDITLWYEFIGNQNKDAIFDLAIDGGSVIASKKMDSLSTDVTLNSIELSKGHNMEYRVFVSDGTKVRINRIEIHRIN